MLEELVTMFDRQKSYIDLKHKPIEFRVGDKVMLKVSPWKGVVRFGKRGQLNPRIFRTFQVLEQVGSVAYKLELPKELSRVHNTFHDPQRNGYSLKDKNNAKTDKTEHRNGKSVKSQSQSQNVKITSTLKYKDVPETSIKLMIFPFSIDGPAQIWLDKEPSHSIFTWDDLVSKFINHFFPPSKTTNLRNGISNFQQKFEETFSEAWDRFKDLLRACPHHGFTKFHQLNTFYNGLNPSAQDSLNFAAGGNILERSAQDVAVTSAMTAMFKQHQVTSAPASVKAVKESCVTCGGAHSYRQCPATDGNTFSGYQDNIQGYVSASAVNYNQGNTGYRPQSVANQIRPPGFAKPNVQNNQTWYNQGYNQNRGINQGNLNYQAPAYQAPIHQPQVVTTSDFSNYMKDNDALDECLALVDLSASINLMPLSIWKKLSLPELTPTQMILERADRSNHTTETSIVEVCPLTGRALIDVYGEELTLRHDDEAVTFKVVQTSRYSYNDDVSINRIDVIDVAYHILSTSSPSLTPFEEGDFILEEIEACLTNDSIPPRIDDDDFDPEGYLTATQEEKCHFMVKEGIVLGHKISKSGIEVDKDKVDVIAKLPHLTFVKGIRSFLGHVGFYHRFIQDFSKIARPMTHLLEKDTPFIFSKECIESFNILKKKLTEAPILVTPDWDLPFELMCNASDYAVGAVLGQQFDVIIPDKKGAEDLAADHLSRRENRHQDVLENKEITKTFPLETLGMVTFRGDSSTSWFADFANYHAGNFVIKGMPS
ncbi:reverse transcriptase domain-containing protein [Tanacetum coccineum]